MYENLQRVGVVGKDMEPTSSDDDARLLLSNLADGLCLGVEQLARRLVVLQSIILRTGHVAAVEQCEVVTPQWVATLYLLHRILYGTEAAGHLIHNLLVEQLHMQPPCKLCTNLVSTSAKLTTDGNDEFFLLVHIAQFC